MGPTAADAMKDIGNSMRRLPLNGASIAFYDFVHVMNCCEVDLQSSYHFY